LLAIQGKVKKSGRKWTLPFPFDPNNLNRWQWKQKFHFHRLCEGDLCYQLAAFAVAAFYFHLNFEECILTLYLSLTLILTLNMSSNLFVCIKITCLPLLNYKYLNYIHIWLLKRYCLQERYWYQRHTWLVYNHYAGKMRKTTLQHYGSATNAIWQYFVLNCVS